MVACSTMDNLSVVSMWHVGHSTANSLNKGCIREVGDNTVQTRTIYSPSGFLCV